MNKNSLILTILLCFLSLWNSYAQVDRYPDVGFSKSNQTGKDRITKMIKFYVRGKDTLKEDSYFDVEGHRIKVVSYEFEQVGRQTFYKWEKGLLANIVSVSPAKDTTEFYYSHAFPIIKIYENVKGKKELSRELFYNKDSTNSIVINYFKGKVSTIDSINYSKSSVSSMFYEKGKILLEDVMHIIDSKNEIGYTLDSSKKMTEFTKRIYNDSRELIQEIRAADTNVVITNYSYQNGKLMSEEEIYNGCTKYSTFYKYE